MKKYLKPTIQERPNHVILHVGKNNVKRDRELELLSKFVVYLTYTLKSNATDVNIFFT